LVGTTTFDFLFEQICTTSVCKIIRLDANRYE
jgi:hypothetical protein